MEEKAKQIAELLKLLGNENRLMILCALMNGAMTVTRLADKVPDISQSALSQHLGLLKSHGVLCSEKRGMNRIYSIEDPRVEEMIRLLKKYYCDPGENNRK